MKISRLDDLKREILRLSGVLSDLHEEKKTNKKRWENSDERKFFFQIEEKVVWKPRFSSSNQTEETHSYLINVRYFSLIPVCWKKSRIKMIALRNTALCIRFRSSAAYLNMPFNEFSIFIRCFVLNPISCPHSVHSHV